MRRHSIKAHKRPAEQSLFPIIQGGLDLNLRRICVQGVQRPRSAAACHAHEAERALSPLEFVLGDPPEMTKRPAAGFAIGGLSGGEDKDKFWRVVHACTDVLPVDKPRYCMGVGCGRPLPRCRRALAGPHAGAHPIPSPAPPSACATALRWTWSSVSRWA